MNRALSGCFPYAALALAGLLVWPFVAGSLIVKLLLVCWILGFGSVAIAKLRMGLERRDKYDLNSLQQVHDREALRAVEVPSVNHDADEAVCPRCAQVYDARFPRCPHCGG